jgi:hypothetical protein
MKYQNIVVTVSNYATNYLYETLNDYGQQGFKLVNVVMAKNKYYCDVMYLFFTKEMVGEQK